MDERHRRRPAARPSQLSRQTRCFVCAWCARHAVSVFNQGSIILGGSGLCRFHRYSSIAIWSDLHHHTRCLSGPDSGNVEEMHTDAPVSLSRGSHSPECRSHSCLCQGPFECTSNKVQHQTVGEVTISKNYIVCLWRLRRLFFTLSGRRIHHTQASLALPHIGICASRFVTERHPHLGPPARTPSWSVYAVFAVSCHREQRPTSGNMPRGPAVSHSIH
jgi:hypothetical protein